MFTAFSGRGAQASNRDAGIDPASRKNPKLLGTPGIPRRSVRRVPAQLTVRARFASGPRQIRSPQLASHQGGHGCQAVEVPGDDLLVGDADVETVLQEPDHLEDPG